MPDPQKGSRTHCAGSHFRMLPMARTTWGLNFPRVLMKSVSRIAGDLPVQGWDGLLLWVPGIAIAIPRCLKLYLVRHDNTVCTSDTLEVSESPCTFNCVSSGMQLQDAILFYCLCPEERFNSRLPSKR